MTISQAAAELQEKLERFDWLTGVAVGEVDGRQVIYVYLKTPARNAELESLNTDGWRGYPVFVERVGAVHPAPK